YDIVIYWGRLATAARQEDGAVPRSEPENAIIKGFLISHLSTPVRPRLSVNTSNSEGGTQPGWIQTHKEPACVIMKLCSSSIRTRASRCPRWSSAIAR